MATDPVDEAEPEAESKIDRRVFLDGVPRRSDLRMGGAIILGWRAKPPLPLSEGQWEVECATLGTRRAHSVCGQLDLELHVLHGRTDLDELQYNTRVSVLY